MPKKILFSVLLGALVLWSFAAFGQQAASPSSPSKARERARDGRFIAYDDGTVLDTRTNLMWAAKDKDNDIN